MKKITFLFLLIPFFNLAQENINFDTSSVLAFVNATDIGPAPSPGNANFGYDPILTSVVVGDNIEIIPNTEIWMTNNGSNSSFNMFWFSAQDTPRKNLEILTFNEVQFDGVGTPPAIANTELTFSADLSAFDLDGAYSLRLFITVFEAGFSNFRRETFDVPSTIGSTYSVTFPASNVSANDRIWQYGFILDGPMADPAVVATLGSATFSQTVLSTNEFETAQVQVSPNPTKDSWEINSINRTIESIEVFDILGKNVLSLIPNATEVSIDASALITGIYLARVTSQEGTQTLRLVKN